jgi:hypothetical protein
MLQREPAKVTVSFASVALAHAVIVSSGVFKLNGSRVFIWCHFIFLSICARMVNWGPKPIYVEHFHGSPLLRDEDQLDRDLEYVKQERDLYKRLAERNHKANLLPCPQCGYKQAEIRAHSGKNMDTLDALKLAYRKNVLADLSVGWEQMCTAMVIALRKEMGEEEFRKWEDEARERQNQGQ